MPICAVDRDRCLYLGGSLHCVSCGLRKPIERMTRREFRKWDADPWAGDREVARHAAHERWVFILI